MSNKSNRMNQIKWLQPVIVPSPSPFPVSHGGAESGYAWRAIDTEGQTGRQTDMVDGMIESIDEPDEQAGWRPERMTNPNYA